MAATEVYNKRLKLKSTEAMEDSIGKDIRFDDIVMEITSAEAKPMDIWLTLGSQDGTTKNRVTLLQGKNQVDTGPNEAVVFSGRAPSYYNYFTIESTKDTTVTIRISEEDGPGFRNADGT